MKKNLKLPINFSSMVKGTKVTTCSIEESIAQSIMMQITTHYGEVAGRPDFGSTIWDLEFNQLIKVYEWEYQVKKSLIETINKYEKRLKEVEATVKLIQVEKESNIQAKRGIRKQATIYVKGTIIQYNIPFNFNTTLYISPLSQ